MFTFGEMMNQEDFELVETGEVTCIGCAFGKSTSCARHQCFDDCEQDTPEGYPKHFIYKRKEQTQG